MAVNAVQVATRLYLLGGFTFGVFLLLFVWRNAPGLVGLPIITICCAAYWSLVLLAAPGFLGGKFVPLGALPAVVLYVFTAVALVLIFLESTVWDYYQPLSLFDDVIAALALAWLLVIAALVWAAVTGERRLQLGALVLLLGPLLVQALPLLSNPQPGEHVVDHQDLFVGGEGGYDVYRIPALLVLPAGSSLADGMTLERDRVLAIVEARRDGALDTGVIDLVLRDSDDAGQTWSAPRVICRHEDGEVRGKCGNATPLFDAQAGTVWLAYNLSASRPDQPRVHSAQLMQSDDGGRQWGEPQRIEHGDLVFGPGHGIQKRQPPAAGRLLIPAYRGKSALVLYSDDSGLSWKESAALDTGNESELAELASGELYLTTRHAAPIGRPPLRGRLSSRSVDGGATWSRVTVDPALPTPVCQASVYSLGNVLAFSNPAHDKARVRMTVRLSEDGGHTWPRGMEVYPGPAGYSDLGLVRESELLLLYERGKLAYSERVSLARIRPESFPRSPESPPR